MTPSGFDDRNTGSPAISRRTVMSSALAAAGGAAAFGARAGAGEAKPEPDIRRGAAKRYKMKKSINQWAFPYPDRMSLEECM